MSLQSKAEKLSNILTGISGLKCYHLFKPASITAPYAVWQEDSEGNSHYSNNQKAEQIIEISIDYYTKDEYDAMTDSIQEALNNAHIPWTLNSVQYETDTKLLHYEWIAEVV